jgi:hypothetical protein
MANVGYENQVDRNVHIFLFESAMPMETFSWRHGDRAPRICVTKDTLCYIRMAPVHFRTENKLAIPWHLQFYEEFSESLNKVNRAFPRAKGLRAAICEGHLYVQVWYNSTPSVYYWRSKSKSWDLRIGANFTRKFIEHHIKAVNTIREHYG